MKKEKKRKEEKNKTREITGSISRIKTEKGKETKKTEKKSIGQILLKKIKKNTFFDERRNHLEKDIEC